MISSTPSPFTSHLVPGRPTAVVAVAVLFDGLGSASALDTDAELINGPEVGYAAEILNVVVEDGDLISFPDDDRAARRRRRGGGLRRRLRARDRGRADSGEHH